MKHLFTLLFFGASLCATALNPNHFTINRITAPYFIVDGNTPATLTKAYVGFEIINNSNSATSYSGLKLTITSIATSIVGQNYSVVSPSTGIFNVGSLAPGASKVCYFYVSYPASTTAQATFNLSLTDGTATPKTQAVVIRNRSSISANAGGAATQTFTNQDLIGALITDDVTYAVGNVQASDEADFQVAVSTQFDPTKITLLRTEVISSSVPGVNVGSTDSLYFITGNGSNGAAVTVRFTFKITGFNFTTYLLPCAGATSGSTNYKYALNTSLGQGSPVTVSAAANPLTISKTSDQPVYVVGSTAQFTIKIKNPGLFPVTIDKITDEVPAGFVFQSILPASQATASNSTAVPSTGATGAISFEGGVNSVGNNSYYIPAGDSLVVVYSALAPAYTTGFLLTTAKDYVGETEVGSATNTVSVATVLADDGLRLSAVLNQQLVKLEWKTGDASSIAFFEMEKGHSTAAFARIGNRIIGDQRTTFQAVDSVPGFGNNYYRIKAFSSNGEYQYSNIVNVKYHSSSLEAGVAYPNPATSTTSVNIYAKKTQSVTLQLCDMNGRVLKSSSCVCPKGNSIVTVEGLEKFATGVYKLRIISEEGTTQQTILRSAK